MSGFKDSSRMRSGFHFGKGAGFTGSTGKVQNISYTRKTPQRRKFAEGGQVGGSLHRFKNDSQLNVEHGPTGGLRPGFSTGGKAPKKPPTSPPTNPGTTTKDVLTGRKKQMERLGLATGGPVMYAKGGRIPADKAAARALRAHVAAPAPRGHKGLKGC